MAENEIKAILFDLGETLLAFGRVDTAGLLREAAKLSYDFLKQANQPVGRFRSYLWRNLLGLRLRYFFYRMIGRDFDSLAALKKYGGKKGFNLSRQQWEHINWLWYEPLSRKASIEPGLAETLGRLRGAGLKLGIVSNTFVNGCSLEKHLAQEGLLDFFDVRLYSYQFNFRKPDKRIFLAAAQRLGLEAGEIVFVGDRLDMDVKGALNVGMKPILKTAYTNAGKRPPNGVAKIDNISELLKLEFE